jgi:hypothetical protein
VTEVKKILFFDDFYCYHDSNVKRVYKTPDWDFSNIFGWSHYGLGDMCAVRAPEKGLYIFHLSVTGESDGKYIETKRRSYTEDGRTVLETVDTPSSDFTSFYDEHEKDPSHRYKSVHASGNEKHKFIDKYGDTVYQSSVFTSPDTVKWSAYNDSVISRGILDCWQSIIYNPISGKYQVAARRGLGDRRICIVESADLITWSEPVCVLHSGASPVDLPRTHYYSMFQHYSKSSDIFYGLLWKLVMPYEDVCSGPMNTELVYSYDGSHWNHTGLSLMPVDNIHLNDHAYKGSPLGRGLVFSMHEFENEMLFYGIASDFEHQLVLRHREVPGRIMNRHICGGLRKDGLVCYAATDIIGEVRTLNLKMNKPELRLNFRTQSEGYIRAALCDIYGNELPDFGIDNFEKLTGDECDFALSGWKGGTVADACAKSEWIQLRLELRSAELYSIAGDFYANVNSEGTLYDRP